jgi:putative restriction endonuclease
MAKAIFTTRVTPSYDDRPEEHYHFPRTYLNQARQAIGDHIIYYEPRRSDSSDSSRGGRLAYFATARVNDVVADPNKPDHFYALVSDFLNFDKPVPFRVGDHYYEKALVRDDGGANRGSFGRSVRLIPDDEFDQILKAGFAAELGRPAWDETSPSEIAEPLVDFERPVVELTISRPFRDRAFRQSVRNAYDNRCALTGLRLINGGGRPEVQAAHIMPVASKGPDSVRNGLALSGTVHWLFDRGLISIEDNRKILVAKSKVPDQVLKLLNADGHAWLPENANAQPHPHYLKFHRENVFKG